MRKSNQLIRLIGFVSVLLSIDACELLSPWDSYHQDTAAGRNTLSFTINGENICQKSGVVCFGGPIERLAIFRVDTQGNIIVEAELKHDLYKRLSFLIPAYELIEGNHLHPDQLSLVYDYLPTTYQPYTYEVNGVVYTEYRLEQEGECRSATITDSSVSINRWDSKNKILAGNFSFEGYYSDSTGDITHFIVTDGLFDVRDDVLNYTY